MNSLLDKYSINSMNINRKKKMKKTKIDKKIPIKLSKIEEVLDKNKVIIKKYNNSLSKYSLKKNQISRIINNSRKCNSYNTSNKKKITKVLKDEKKDKKKFSKKVINKISSKIEQLNLKNKELRLKEKRLKIKEEELKKKNNKLESKDKKLKLKNKGIKLNNKLKYIKIAKSKR